MAMDYKKRLELQQTAEALLIERYNGGRDLHEPGAVMRAVRAAAYNTHSDQGEGRLDVPVDDVLAALTQVEEERRRLERLELDLIRAARTRGASWQRVADGLGLGTRQSAETRAMRLENAAVSSHRCHDVSAARIERARQRAAEAWCEEHEDRIREVCERLYDAAEAWMELDTEVVTASYMHELGATLAAGGSGAQLMRCLETLRSRFAPYNKPRLKPTVGKRANGKQISARQAAEAAAARDAMVALYVELWDARLAVVSAREARS